MRRGDRDHGGSRPAAGTLLLALALLAAAAAFDAEPLYVPGVAFGLLAVLCLLWVRLAAAGLRVRRTVSGGRVQEDDPLPVTVTVVGGVLRLPTGEIRDPLLRRARPLQLGRDRQVVQATARLPRRGRRLVAPPSVLVRDPFGLAARTVGGGEPTEVLVLPRVDPVVVTAAGADGTGLGLRRRHRPTSAEVEVDGVGPLRPGTPASRIHWPSIARRAEPQERRLHADGGRLPVVVLDPSPDPGDPQGAADDLDAAVRAVASLAVHLARRGGCEVLLPGDRRPTELDATLGGWARLHVRLALVEAGPAPATAQLRGRTGPIVHVSARRVQRPPRALAQHGAGQVLVVPGSIAGRRPAFAVAGCAGYELADRLDAARSA
ncbi:DUF58 domain-containing protein [Conexibacter sp. W3-3-2]|uniref:DUF58 domain-containing protein n=1 Tax=Conexibacter sp. W3-3-2 TaxID=2675227 RepID=UPI0012B8D1AB|nr:DUF58 domain-containing protein [Conexibacter sp. W3-3-2]MTD43148.1 DUF58 domain-containing protein [Conexibacter sp. W3-3-2]